MLVARTGQHEYEIVNAALRSLLGLTRARPSPQGFGGRSAGWESAMLLSSAQARAIAF
jgi:hypothetical protein